MLSLCIPIVQYKKSTTGNIFTMSSATVLESVNGFLSSAPVWMKWTALAWVLLTLILIFTAAYLKLFGANNGRVATESENSIKLSLVNSHYEAAQIEAYHLDCKRHILESQPNLSTFELRLCQTLSEARMSLKNLVITRNALKGSPREWKKPTLSTNDIGRYITSDFKDEAYAVVPEKFNEWLKHVNSEVKNLQSVVSVAEYEKWLLSTGMTLDDLIFAFGFIDWAVAYDAKGRLAPGEFYKLGPFMSSAFTDQEFPNLALKYFIHSDGSVMTYIDEVSNLD